MKYIKNTAH